jgi:hypothetical protein
METVRMVAFRSHMRGEVVLKRGDEFEVTEEEAHAYAARKNPLAGQLEDAGQDEPAVVTKPPDTSAPAPKPAKKPARPRGKPRKGR